MKNIFLQSDAGVAGESVGQIVFYVIIIGLGIFLYVKMRNKNKNSKR